MTTLGEITSKDGNRTEIHELESISRVVQEGKAKVSKCKQIADFLKICKILEMDGESVNRLAKLPLFRKKRFMYLVK